MAEFRLQNILIANAEEAIARAYYEWGRGFAGDSPEPDWDMASSDQRCAIMLRGYALYDGLCLPQNDSVGPTEIYTSMGINSRITLLDAVRFLRRSGEARSLLASIPLDLRLEDGTEATVRFAAQLIDLFRQEHQIGYGKATKVLHKKRPTFIPILDSYAVDFLSNNFPHRLGRNPSTEQLLVLCQELLVILDKPLSRIQDNLAELGILLPTLRIFDFLVWIGWTAIVGDGNWPTVRAVWRTKSVEEARALAASTWEAQKAALI